MAGGRCGLITVLSLYCKCLARGSAPCWRYRQGKAGQGCSWSIWHNGGASFTPPSPHPPHRHLPACFHPSAINTFAQHFLPALLMTHDVKGSKRRESNLNPREQILYQTATRLVKPAPNKWTVGKYSQLVHLYNSNKNKNITSNNNDDNNAQICN